jgi:hypothetical protein
LNEGEKGRSCVGIVENKINLAVRIDVERKIAQAYVYLAAATLRDLASTD